MAIYKRDVVTIDGKVVSGERVDGQPEIRMPYRIAASITNGGMTYVFSHMEKGEAVYKLGDKPVVESTKIKPPNQDTSTTDGANVLTELPPNAITDADFTGRYKTFNGKRYQLYQPVSKFNGKFVYIPA